MQEPELLNLAVIGGGKRVRTADPLLAGQVLYQLSYTPIALLKRLHYRLQGTCPLAVINKTNAPQLKS